MSAYYPDDINQNSKDCPWNAKDPVFEQCFVVSMDLEDDEDWGDDD